MKPVSVKKFDILYLGSVALGLIALALDFDNVVGGMSESLAAVSMFFLVVISAALWFLVSVLRIEAVKWIIALFMAYSVYSFALGFSPEIDLRLVLEILSTVMTLAAIYYLFRPDAKAWFSEKRSA